jgi:hypothetical protein
MPSSGKGLHDASHMADGQASTGDRRKIEMTLSLLSYTSAITNP